MQRVNCEEIHSGKLQTNAAYKASAVNYGANDWKPQQLSWLVNICGNVRDNCYPHIRLFPTHPHLASVDFIRLLPVATSVHPLITHSLFLHLDSIQWLVLYSQWCYIHICLLAGQSSDSRITSV